MQQTSFATLNVKEIACPKCGKVGSLMRHGRDYRKKYHRVWCSDCERTSTELQLMQLAGMTTKVAFDLDDYSEERQMKIQQLIGILREHPDWGSFKLQKELQRLNMGISKSEIIKVKNAFSEGSFNV